MNNNQEGEPLPCTDDQLVEKTNQEIDTIQDVNISEAEIMEKKRSRTDDIQEALVYVNLVLKRLADQPNLLEKFFYLMREYRSDSNKEKLKHGLFSLFNKSYPELAIELRKYADYFGSTNSLEDLRNMYEDEIMNNELCISRINSAINNMVKFLMPCGRQRSRREMMGYLSSEDLKEIAEHCNVNLVKCKDLHESAYFVVGKLEVQLEVAKKNGLKILKNMASDIGDNKRRRMD